MQENNTEIWAEVGAPTDLWGAGKALTFAGPEEAREAWSKTVDTLEGLCIMAEGLRLEPLLLTAVDAKGRAEEELARVADACERPEGAAISESEDRRVMDLLARADALGNACAAVEDEGVSPDAVARDLEVLWPMRDEALRNFNVYRRELGLGS
jgi:hypothetical protein